MSERGGELPNSEAELLSAAEAPIQVFGFTSGAQYFGESKYRLGSLEPETAQGLGATVWLDNSADSFALRTVIELPDDLIMDGDEALFQQLSGYLTTNGNPYNQRDSRILFNSQNKAAPLDNVITLASSSERGTGRLFIYTRQNTILGSASSISSTEDLKYHKYSISSAARSLGRTTADVLNALYALQGRESDAQITLSIDIPEGTERPVPQPETQEPEPRPGTALVKVERPLEGYLQVLAGYPSFNDFGGLDVEIAELKRAAKMLDAPAALLDDYGLEHPGGLILQGPGGVGKTSLVKAWARHMKAELREITVSDILDRYVGESTKKLRAVYEKANTAGHRVVVCFNELDGLFSRKASGNEGVAESLIAEFKQILENPGKYPNVVTAATANSLAHFDPNLLRPGRFGFAIAIGLPNEKARTEIFSVYLYKRPRHFEIFSADDMEDIVTSGNGVVDHRDGMINVPELVAMTEDWTGDDVRHVVHSELWTNLMEELDTGVRPARITHERLVRAIRNHRQHRPSGTDEH
jgi:SpoVK/Ycf46/Vps4 family AAA+-type ATPase